MKTEFTLTLFDNDRVREKLKVMSPIEAMFDDADNKLPEEYYFFSDDFPIGRTMKVTFELVDSKNQDD